METLSKLIPALIKAQKEFEPLIKSSTNPFFKSKYADLEACWDSVKIALHKNGLTIYSTTHVVDGRNVLDTFLVHESGESIHSEYLITPVKNDPQSEGSALTYARRYSLSALLTLCPENDDDGNSATRKLKPKSEPVNLATPEQLTDLKKMIEILNTPQESIDKWLTKEKVDTLEEMTTEQIQVYIDAGHKKIAELEK